MRRLAEANAWARTRLRVPKTTTDACVWRACYKASHAPLPSRSAVRPGRDAAGDRTQERETVRPPARQAPGRARARRAVPPALRGPGPAFTAKDPRRRSRDDRHDPGQGD